MLPPPTLPFPSHRVRSIVTDLQKQTQAKKAYKGFAIALFILVLAALVAMFGTSLAANAVLKDTKLDTSGGHAAMKAMDGTPISVDVTQQTLGFFDIPRLDAMEMAQLQTLAVYVDMTGDKKVGEWVEYAAKIATAYKGTGTVAFLKTMTGDTITIDGGAKTASLETFGGLEFPVAVEVPDGSGRRLSALETVAAFGTFDLDDLVWPSPSPEPPEPERRELSGPAGVMPVPAPNDARPVDTDILAELLA